MIINVVIDIFSVRPAHNIMAIDMGVENFAAITNNAGKPCLLFKGGVAKSVNQLYNKVLAEERSIAVCKYKKELIAKGLSQEELSETMKHAHVPESDKARRFTIWREHSLNDYMHKVAKNIISYALLWNIDTIVVGWNPLIKQCANMQKINNQNFVCLPYGKFKRILNELCQINGIRYIEREESYTSKASFLDGDYIPTYKVDDEGGVHFSGKRVKRGLYKSKDGTIINADLNGSANILRKTFPDAFETYMPLFNNAVIIKHPDYDKMKANYDKQRMENKDKYEKNLKSKAAIKRQNRKQNAKM